eukprot:gene16065-11494_t
MDDDDDHSCYSDCHEKEVQPLEDVMGTASSTLPMETPAVSAHHQSAGDERDAVVAQLKQQFEDHKLATDAEIAQLKQQAAEKDAVNVRWMARAMFCRDLKATPLQSFADLMQRIEALGLPPMDDVSSTAEPVGIKAAAASSMGPSVVGNKRLDMSNFNYLWLTKEQKLQSPYLQMEIVNSALDDVLASHFFDSDATQYDTFVTNHARILQRLRAVLWYYLYDTLMSGMLDERDHMTPMAGVFVKSLIDQLPECRLNLTARAVIQANFKATESNTQLDTSKTDKLTFPTKLFDTTTGKYGDHVVSGFSDLVITDAADDTSFRAIIELKLRGKLQPSAVQKKERGQVFGEMLGLKCRHPQRPLYVGVLTDLFSLYVLLA